MQLSITYKELEDFYSGISEAIKRPDVKKRGII
jgi:hypothetical protein